MLYLIIGLWIICGALAFYIGWVGVLKDRHGIQLGELVLLIFTFLAGPIGLLVNCASFDTFVIYRKK